MKTTKEECMSAFMNLAHGTGTKKCKKNITCDECENQCKTRKQYDKDCLLIEKLIKEYFDNPPLKFDEIKKGDWVWDNRDENYKQVAKKTNKQGIYWYGIYSEYESDKFEENRFYRKQVIENE